jgi:hypothetical protein
MLCKENALALFVFIVLQIDGIRIHVAKVDGPALIFGVDEARTT